MKKVNILFYTSLVCALWFALTSAAWTYFINIFISFPFGIAAFFLYRAGTKIEGRSKRFRIVDAIILIGAFIALLSLFGFLMFN